MEYKELARRFSINKTFVGAISDNIEDMRLIQDIYNMSKAVFREKEDALIYYEKYKEKYKKHLNLVDKYFGIKK